MENPDTITVQLLPPLLDALEAYVQDCEAYQRQANDVPSGDYRAAVEKYRSSAEGVANWLEVTLADQDVPGSLGKTLAEARRNREARLNARASDSPNALYVYNCTVCGHAGECRLPESAPEVTTPCSACGAQVVAEWDGGVRLVSNKLSESGA